MENLKIFEMPVPGYLGFPAFAFECFTIRPVRQSCVAGTRIRSLAEPAR
jgi:hypothetical protein